MCGHIPNLHIAMDMQLNSEIVSLFVAMKKLLPFVLLFWCLLFTSASFSKTVFDVIFESNSDLSEESSTYASFLADGRVFYAIYTKENCTKDGCDAYYYCKDLTDKNRCPSLDEAPIVVRKSNVLSLTLETITDDCLFKLYGTCLE